MQREWDEVITELPSGVRAPIVRRLVAYSLPSFVDLLSEGGTCQELAWHHSLCPPEA
jgi:hypothetical protein